MSLTKGHENMLGGSYILGEAERVMTDQPGEEKVQGDLVNVYKYLIRKRKEVGV